MAAAPVSVPRVMYWLSVPSQSGLARNGALTTGTAAASTTANRWMKLRQKYSPECEFSPACSTCTSQAQMNPPNAARALNANTKAVHGYMTWISRPP